jgi:hypothetical protein
MAHTLHNFAYHGLTDTTVQCLMHLTNTHVRCASEGFNAGDDVGRSARVPKPLATGLRGGLPALTRSAISADSNWLCRKFCSGAELTQLVRPLQSRQCALWTSEDELVLALTPCAPLVEALALHHEVRHQAQGHMGLLSPLPWQGLLLGGPLVACLTGFQAQVTLPSPNDLFPPWRFRSRVRTSWAVRLSRFVA